MVSRLRVLGRRWCFVARHFERRHPCACAWRHFWQRSLQAASCQQPHQALQMDMPHVSNQCPLQVELGPIDKQASLQRYMQNVLAAQDTILFRGFPGIIASRAFHHYRFDMDVCCHLQGL